MFKIVSTSKKNYKTIININNYSRGMIKCLNYIMKRRNLQLEQVKINYFY